MSLTLGLTGGIGSGKSTAADLFARRGAVIIDSDVLAREVVEPGTPGLSAIVDRFGPGVLSEEGSLDRPALGQIVFADAQARADLNAIIHPAVRRAAADITSRVRSRDPHAIIIEDIPLLTETGAAPRFHAVIVVELTMQTRIARLVGRGMDEADARSRIAAQATDAERREIADILLDNEGTVEDLEHQVGKAWVERIIPYRRALIGGGPVAPATGPVDEGQVRRVLERLRYALAGTDSEIRAAGGHVTLSTALADPTDLLLTAGFVPSGPGVYTSADPGAPVSVLLKDAREEPPHVS